MDLVGLYVDALTAYGVKAPKRVVGMVARQIKLLRDEGQPEEHIALGLKLMADKGEKPTALPIMLVAAIRKTERAEIAEFYRTFGWPTGCRTAKSLTALHHVYDPLGTERPPDGWPHDRPTRIEVETVLASLKAIGHFIRGGKPCRASMTKPQRAQSAPVRFSSESRDSGADGARDGSSTTTNPAAKTSGLPVKLDDSIRSFFERHRRYSVR